MKMYVLSLGTGVLVGVIYALLGVKSPAPPVVALVGLLGMLAGERLPSLGHRLFAPHTEAAAPPSQDDQTQK